MQMDEEYRRRPRALLNAAFFTGVAMAVYSMGRLFWLQRLATEPTGAYHDGMLKYQRMRLMGHGIAVGSVGLLLTASCVFVVRERPLGLIPLLLR